MGAYLTQELGFTNVSRLAGGIIAYDRTLEKAREKGEIDEPLFKGTNYVFDGRVGRQITNDALGTCVSCGAKASLLSNCRNNNCHKRMVQCAECSSKLLGTCSEACRQRVLNGGMVQRRLVSLTTEKADADEPYEEEKKEAAIVCNTLDQYSTVYSSKVPPLYSAIEHNTKRYLPTGAHMVSGATQGRLLYSFASMTRGGRVLEIGTFTGYATASFLEGCADAGEALGYTVVGGRAGGPFVLSLERDQRAYDVAAAHLRLMSQSGVGKEAAAEALDLSDEREFLESD